MTIATTHRWKRWAATALATALVGGALSAAGLAGAAPSATAADPQLLEKNTVWAAGSGSVASHRIPSLVVTTAGTVLVATEARITNGDDDPHHLVVKRSTDGGQSWGADITIEASSAGESWANPTPVVDQSTGRIVLFYALNHDNVSSQVFYRSSDDDGVTWSSRVEVTSLFDGNPEGWTFHLPGPGHGIQLADGRLLVEVWHRKSVTLPAASRAYGATVVYSDDGGAASEAGGGPALDTAYPIGEAGVEQRADGSLLMLGRYSVSGTHSRIGAVSADGGETWSDAFLAAGIPSATTVQAGYARFRADGDSVSRLLFSRPVGATTRTDLTLAVSYDEGESFPVERVVQSGAAAYSDIATLDDGTILVLYEVGSTVQLARLNLEWLTNGTDSVDDGPAVTRTVIEAEGLTRTASDPTSVVSDPILSGGAYVELDGSATGDYLDVAFTAPAAGTYDLGIHYLTRNDRANFAVTVDGSPVAAGSPVTGYTSIRKYPVADLGAVTLTAGTHHLRLQVTGKSSSSSDYRIGLDYLTLSQ